MAAPPLPTRQDRDGYGDPICPLCRESIRPAISVLGDGKLILHVGCQAVSGVSLNSTEK